MNDPGRAHGRGTATRQLLASLFLLATSGAAPGSAMADEPTLREVDTITIMPIAFPVAQKPEDRRERLPSLYGEVDENVYKGLLRKLALKGYVLDKPREWAIPADWSAESLRALTHADLAAVAPASASFVAFLFVERLEASKQVVHSSADATVAAMILHRPTATVVWANSAQGEWSENVVGGLFVGGPLLMWLTPDKHAALEKAFSRLFADFPEATTR